MAEGSDIRFERQGSLGIVWLDRQGALNALTHAMITNLRRQLDAWVDDPSIGAVVVRAAKGRAFCAGGDVRAVCDLYRREGLAVARRFFWDEYRLNWRIKTYPKPYLALLDGVTMGGGVGISAHGTYQVVTERTLWAMPETAIGFFPDVGTTFALTHPPLVAPEVGLFLGLTGARLGPADCLAFGLAKHGVPAAGLDRLVERLAALDPAASGYADALSTALSSEPLAAEPGAWARHRSLIERCFAAPTLDQLLAALEAEPTGWGNEQLEILRAASPFAVCLTMAQLQLGRQLDIEAALRLEYRIVQRVLAYGDFHEGVRALLVDKDRRPRWRDAAIEAVPPGVIAACLAPLDDPADELRFGGPPVA